MDLKHLLRTWNRLGLNLSSHPSVRLPSLPHSLLPPLNFLIGLPTLYLEVEASVHIITSNYLQLFFAFQSTTLLLAA